MTSQENDRVLLAPPGFDIEANSGAIAQINSLLDELSREEIAGENPGHPQRGNVGSCRLCGTVTTLTFEHIPPESAGNNSPRRSFNLLDVLSREDVEIGQSPRNGYTQSQRGMGASVLCRKCNNDTGTILVPHYSAFSNAILKELAENCPVVDGVVQVPGTVDLRLTEVPVGAVAREALVNLLAASGSAAISNEWPALRRLVDGETGTLPEGMKLGLQIALGGRAQLYGVQGRISDNRIYLATEFAFQPFCWTLCITPHGMPAHVEGTDVSNWFGFTIDETPEVSASIPVGAIFTGISGDFRDEETARSESSRQDRTEQAENDG